MEEIKVEDSLEKAKLLKRKTELLSEITKCNIQIDQTQQKIKDLKLKKPLTISAADQAQIEMLKKQTELSLKEREALAKEMDLIEHGLEMLKLVKKAVCLANIRYLLKEHPEVKIGQIEAEGGVSTGYTSKLERAGNKSDPPIEYIAAAAKAFNISIDTLLFVPLEEMTASEKYLLRFLEKVERETTDEKMIWKRESNMTLNKSVSTDAYDFIHPLLVPDKESFDSYGNYHEMHFQSRFFPEKTVRITADLYHAEMTNTGSMLYILPETLTDHPGGKEELTGFELYIYDSQEVTPICNTMQAHPAIAKAVAKLYSLIQESSAHVKLDEKARSLIDAFMDPKPKAVVKVKPMVKLVKQVNPFEELEDDGELPF